MTTHSSRRTAFRLLLSVLAATTLAFSSQVASASAEPVTGSTLPVPYSLAVAALNAATHPDTSPPGSNDWTCRPGAEHPRPVVLVHGTQANMTVNWNSLSPLLKNAGYCVFALNYGQEPDRHYPGYPGSAAPGGTAPLDQSAAQLARFVDRVRAATGSSEVDIVGHSQGGLMPRYYLKSLGGSTSVHTLIGLAPPNHGTDRTTAGTPPGTSTVVPLVAGAAWADETTGSPFLTELNAGGDTVPGVDYTVIESRYDTTVSPYTSAFLEGSEVTNILIQDQCPEATTDHAGLAFDPYALGLVLHALDKNTPAAACSAQTFPQRSSSDQRP